MDYQNTHREIVEQCQSGNRQAQFELYRLYSKAMYNLCLRMMKSEMSAEDMLQKSFTQVFMKIHTFRFESSVGAWIKRITVNNCINQMKKKRLEIQELDDRFHHIPEPEADDTDCALSIDMVNAAMMQLPDGYRVVFSLYLMEGYDHKEIGEVLGISEATSKSQFSRAKAKMRTLLAEVV